MLEQLPTKLSEETQIDIGLRLARLNILIGEKMELKKGLPKTIEALQEEATVLAHQMESGTEVKTVECEWRLDNPEPGKKSFYRLDTEQIVRVADMDIFDIPRDKVLFDLMKEAFEPKEDVGKKYLEFCEQEFNDLEMENISVEEKAEILRNIQEQFEIAKVGNIIVEEYDYSALRRLMSKVLNQGPKEGQAPPEKVEDEGVKDANFDYEIVDNDPLGILPADPDEQTEED